MTEVRVARAGGDDEIVVGDCGTVREQHPPAGNVDGVRLAKQHANVRRPPDNPPDRRRDVAGRQRGGGHLIEQRLEEMVVMPIQQRDAEGPPPQDFGRRQPSESATNDNDMSG